jgi:hypothetical protein
MMPTMSKMRSVSLCGANASSCSKRGRWASPLCFKTRGKLGLLEFLGDTMTTLTPGCLANFAASQNKMVFKLCFGG